MAFKAFVSSTYEDLKEHRQFVINQLRKAGIFVDPMEDWTASMNEPKQFSQARVRDCDLCVLLVGLRRGHVPIGEHLSITQLEYLAARRYGLDIMIFMLHEQTPWPRSFDELDKDPEIRRWREELLEQNGILFFQNTPESIEIATALVRWLQERITIKREFLLSSNFCNFCKTSYLAFTEKACTYAQGRRILRSPRLGIEFLQERNHSPMFFMEEDEWVEVFLQKVPFEIRIPKCSEHDAVRLCASKDDHILRMAAKPGATIVSISRSTGFADYKYGSGHLFIREGHHYFTGHRLSISEGGKNVIFVSSIEGYNNLPSGEDIFLLLSIETKEKKILSRCNIKSLERFVLRFR